MTFLRAVSGRYLQMRYRTEGEHISLHGSQRDTLHNLQNPPCYGKQISGARQVHVRGRNVLNYMYIHNVQTQPAK